MTKEQVRTLLASAGSWVSAHPDLRGLAVAGSWARGTARANSDLDLIILASDPQLYRGGQGWLGDFALLAPYRIRSWGGVDYGVVWSSHILLEPAAELELTFCGLAWPSTNPLDPGTRRVVAGGFRVILDKDGRLAPLTSASTSQAPSDSVFTRRVLPAV